MPISESMVQDIVQEVMAKMQIADAPTADTANNANADAELVAKITKQVMAQLGLK